MEEAGVHLCFDVIVQNLLICVLFTAIVMSSSLMFLICFSGFVFGRQVCSCVSVCV